MSDDDEEMRRLREHKRHRSFEKKYGRDEDSRTKSASLKRKREEMAAERALSSVSSLESQTSSLTPASVRESLPLEFGGGQKHKHRIKMSGIKAVESSGDLESTLSKSSAIVRKWHDSAESGHLEERRAAKKLVKQICERYALPVRFEAKLKGPKRAVSCVSPDKSGSRLLVGSLDNCVYFYDFGGMDSSLSHFRELTPQSGYPIVALSWNPSGSHFLCVSGSQQPTVYDRDGFLVTEFVRGDMYIRDLKHTKGHTANLRGGQWLAKAQKQKVATWANDGCLRVWDVHRAASCLCVCKCVDARGSALRRVRVTAAQVSEDCGAVVAAVDNGSLQLFDARALERGGRPLRTVCAHLTATDTSSVCFDPTNARLLATRGGDDTLKLWDLRRFKKALKTFDNLPNAFATTTVCFSPDSALIVTGTTVPKEVSTTEPKAKATLIETDEMRAMARIKSEECPSADEMLPESERGAVVFIEKKGADSGEVYRMPMSAASVTCLNWSAAINHVFVGGSDKVTRALFDPRYSKKGALLCAKRKEKKRHIDAQLTYLNVINPNALREFRSDCDRIAVRNRHKARRAQRLKTRPELPAKTTEGKDGKMGIGSFVAHVFKDVEKNVRSKVDPRETLLSWAQRTAHDEDTQQWTAVYKVTQPTKHFAAAEDDASELGPATKKRKLLGDTHNPETDQL